MASITSEKLKEMEAEMNRFEAEILTSDAGGMPPMIIGSQTFTRVQQQLSHKHPHDLPGPPGVTSEPSMPPMMRPPQKIPVTVLTPPPPPPPQNSAKQSLPKTENSNLFLPPPPPPPLPSFTPSFIPHQLRHRGPAPPMPRPGHMMPPRPPPPPVNFRGPMGPGHMGGPPMGMMGPRGPMMGPRGMGPVPFGMPQPMNNMNNMNNSQPGVVIEKPKHLHVIEKAKVVYSSAPVKNVTTEDEKVIAPTEETKVVEDIVPPVSDVAAVEGNYPPTVETGDVVVGDTEMEGDAPVSSKKEKKDKKKKFLRTAAGTTWEDPTLLEWEPDDFRMFCGDLGNEVTDEHLIRAFSKYPSFIKAKVIRDRRSNKTKGYGFASFRDPTDFTRAMREMNGKYVGNRPVKLRKSTWKDRSFDVVRRKDKEKKRLGLR